MHHIKYNGVIRILISRNQKKPSYHDDNLA